MTDRRGVARVFFASTFLLFLELACIRFFPARVVFLTFFTNTVLLASFVGMSVGCMLADSRRNHIAWTPALLAVSMLLACWIEFDLTRVMQMLDFGARTPGQIVFFGAEYTTPDLAHFVVPIELLGGGFFALIALVMIGPGQELGRALRRVPNRLHAYTANIVGSILGVVLFGACSLLQWPAWIWFSLVAAGLVVLIGRRMFVWRGAAQATTLVSLAAIAYLAQPNLIPRTDEYWSPYYRINVTRDTRTILTNLIGHQQMVSRREDPHNTAAIAYSLPYMLRRDAGAPPFHNVLIIGAGSGNDVSAALAWGVKHVDAVEIDPVIHAIGVQEHPDHPYADPRVSVYINDGRNFLRSTPRQYDLVVFALVDSLVLHSSYSSIRLESYLFTREAFEDVRRHLAPGGEFVMYNYFRQGWIGIRLHHTLRDAFGRPPIVFALPYQAAIEPGPLVASGFNMFLAGDTVEIEHAFTGGRRYRLAAREVPGPASPNGFAVERTADPAPQVEVAPAGVDPAYPALIPTDEWPFLYLRDRIIPALSLRGMSVMALASLALMVGFLGGTVRSGGLASDTRRMFFLGAGFMLIETRAVVRMALLYGGTWIVNTTVFCAVLVMILFANLAVLALRPARLWPAYAGLIASLAVNVLVPLNFFLGLPAALQAIASSLLVFSPVLFAGIIFAVCFDRTTAPDKALGANLAGSIFGGLAEYTSMVLGFRYLTLVALLLYLCSVGRLQAEARAEAAPHPEPQAAPAGGPA